MNTKRGNEHNSRLMLMSIKQVNTGSGQCPTKQRHRRNIIKLGYQPFEELITFPVVQTDRLLCYFYCCRWSAPAIINNVFGIIYDVQMWGREVAEFLNLTDFLLATETVLSLTANWCALINWGLFSNQARDTGRQWVVRWMLVVTRISHRYLLGGDDGVECLQQLLTSYGKFTASPLHTSQRTQT